MTSCPDSSAASPTSSAEHDLPLDATRAVRHRQHAHWRRSHRDPGAAGRPAVYSRESPPSRARAIHQLDHPASRRSSRTEARRAARSAPGRAFLGSVFATSRSTLRHVRLATHDLECELVRSSSAPVARSVSSGSSSSLGWPRRNPPSHRWVASADPKRARRRAVEPSLAPPAWHACQRPSHTGRGRDHGQGEASPSSSSRS